MKKISPRKLLLIRRSSSRDEKETDELLCNQSRRDGTMTFAGDENGDIFCDGSISVVPYEVDECDEVNQNGRHCILDDAEAVDLVLHSNEDRIVTVTKDLNQPSSSSGHKFNTPVRHNSSIRRNNLYAEFDHCNRNEHRNRGNGGRSSQGSICFDAAHILSDTIEDATEFVDQRFVPTAMNATKDIAKYVIPAMRDTLTETLQECVRDLDAVFCDASIDLGSSIEAIGTSVAEMGAVLSNSFVIQARPMADFSSEELKEWRCLLATVFDMVPYKTSKALIAEDRRSTCEFLLIPFVSCLLVAADLYGTGAEVRSETRLIVFILILAQWLRQIK